MFLKMLGIAICLFFMLSSGCSHNTKPEPTPLPIPTQTPTPQPEVTESVVVHFDFSSSLLNADQEKVLQEALKEKVYTSVRIVGHTDSQGSDEYNQKLSEQRAATVSKYLQETLKFKGNVSVEGKGEKALLNADKTKKDHAANRRAEIVVILK